MPRSKAPPQVPTLIIGNFAQGIQKQGSRFIAGLFSGVTLFADQVNGKL